MKKKEVRGLARDTAFITRQRKLNGAEGYQAVSALPYGKGRLETSWNLGK
jgi:hypothetical protein